MFIVNPIDVIACLNWSAIDMNGFTIKMIDILSTAV